MGNSQPFCLSLGNPQIKTNSSLLVVNLIRIEKYHKTKQAIKVNEETVLIYEC